MISTRHSLDDARVVHKEAMSLINAGHDVSLILSCNDRFEYKRRDGSIIATGLFPDGEIEHEGLKIYGRPKHKGLNGKWKTYLELSSLASKLNADVYHAHEPDLSLAIAIRAKKNLHKKGKRPLVVHDMHEYPPGVPTDRAPFFLKTPVHFAHILWNWFAIQKIDYVFTANTIVRGFALFLKNRLNADVLYNGPSLKLFPQPSSKNWPNVNQTFLLCHEGSLPFNRGLKEMVEAITFLRDRVSLRIVGDVYGGERTWLIKKIEDNKLHDVIQITGWLPYEKVSEAINDCHAGLILFTETINNRMAGPPNKLFNYMNAGLPALSVDFPEMRQVIIENECGILLQDRSVRSIISAIETLLDKTESIIAMSRNGQKAVRNRYSWEKMEIKLLSAYNKMARSLGA